MAVADLAPVEHDSTLRAAMRSVLDLQSLLDRDPAKRIQAINTIGGSQDLLKLPPLQKHLEKETNSNVIKALQEAIALIQLKDENDSVKLAALTKLKGLHTLSSYDVIKATMQESAAATPPKQELVTAAQSALTAIDNHKTIVNTISTSFRGISTGSVLLVAALGLAITFGLMGVINMAHGEVMVVGAYTTYVVQNVFGPGMALSPFGISITLPGMNTTGNLYECYFLIALPLSFLTAAAVGLVLERGIIQFLYRRPLESLLATWGVSLVMQQLFRMIFGPNNVQVYSPAWLSGNWTINDVSLLWSRVFVIGFALATVGATWLILNRTPLGLFIRSVMQNRAMASCVGVPTEKVNMLTFAFGSGLAGLAGAFLSQISNVGPSLGQNYIIDCFMTVVVGGANSLAGTVVSAFGIGFIDQSLQQILLNPVMGKILVLFGIILFLQWRPAGLFVTKSRSLES
jgi:urea transport system permease protein